MGIRIPVERRFQMVLGIPQLELLNKEFFFSNWTIRFFLETSVSFVLLFHGPSAKPGLIVSSKLPCLDRSQGYFFSGLKRREFIVKIKRPLMFAKRLHRLPPEMLLHGHFQTGFTSSSLRRTEVSRVSF